MALAKLKRQTARLYTIDDYLEIDRESEERWQYLDGEIWMMAGESDEHGDISVNLIRELSSQLKGKDCRVRAKDTKVKTGGFARKAGQSMKGMFSYPDVVVICDEVKHHDKKKDVITNPHVVVEVLSESTGDFDRGDKFMRYRMFNSTLTDYILVAQDKPLVEHFIWQDDNNWKLFVSVGLDASFKIELIECELKLSEIYDRVKFSKQGLKFIEEIADIK